MALDSGFILAQLPVFGTAFALTLGLGVAAIAGALIVGLAGSLVLHLRVPLLRGLVAAYVEVSRNTPLLVQLFLLYFGLPAVGIKWSGPTCAIVGLTFLGGSYMIEAFRAGLDAVGRQQVEAGLSLGLSRAQLVRRVVLPQATATALPALAANGIFLLKETSVVGIIAVPDLMHLSLGLIGLYYKTYESLLLLTAAYVVMILPLSLGLGRLEKRLRHGTHGS